MADRLKVNYRHQFDVAPEDLNGPAEDAVEYELEYLMGVAELCDSERELYAERPEAGALYGIWKSPRFELIGPDEERGGPRGRAGRSRFHYLDAFQDATKELLKLMRTVPTGDYGAWPLDLGDMIRLRMATEFESDEVDTREFCDRWFSSLRTAAKKRHWRWLRGIKRDRSKKKVYGELVFNEEGPRGPEEKRQELDFAGPRWDLIFDDDEDPEEVSEDPINTALLGALRRLSAETRDLLIDHALGQRVQGIANAHGTSKRTAERRLQRAEEALRDAFIDDHPRLYHRPPGFRFTGIDPKEEKCWPVRTLKDMADAEVKAIYVRLVERLRPEDVERRKRATLLDKKYHGWMADF
jgi:DNA-directed RNA polymerase specialized sigma24 family protein